MPEASTPKIPKAGEAVQFWPEQKPFVGRGPYPATVTEVLQDDSMRLLVDNPNTGRKFFANAPLASAPASGVCTLLVDVAAVPAPAPVRVTTSVSGSGGGSST